MKVGGRDFALTKQDVESRMEGEAPELIQKHMVEVNGQVFPPKQVLGHVTGWPRASFTTFEAQRVLTRLGFECDEVGGGRLRHAGRFVMDAARESVRQSMTEHGDASFQRGFRAAAGIALRQLDGKLEDFRGRMKSGDLNSTEQAIYAHLDELKSEIEASCDRFWGDSGIDWRPLTPVARAASSQAVEGTVVP